MYATSPSSSASTAGGTWSAGAPGLDTYGGLGRTPGGKTGQNTWENKTENTFRSKFAKENLIFRTFPPQKITQFSKKSQNLRQITKIARENKTENTFSPKSHKKALYFEEKVLFLKVISNNNNTNEYDDNYFQLF